MDTIFCREGTALDLIELVDMLKEMLEKNIIGNLVKEDLEKFYLRYFEATYESIKIHLESKNYKVVNYRQALVTASQISLVQDVKVWYKALELKETIEATTSKSLMKDEIEGFIKNEYYPCIKSLTERINS